jgi:hypothetical protein
VVITKFQHRHLLPILNIHSSLSLPPKKKLRIYIFFQKCYKANIKRNVKVLINDKWQRLFKAECPVLSLSSGYILNLCMFFQPFKHLCSLQYLLYLHNFIGEISSLSIGLKSTYLEK